MLIELLNNLKEIDLLLKRIKTNTTQTFRQTFAVYGLNSSAKAFFLAYLASQLNRVILVIVANESEVYKFIQDINFFFTVSLEQQNYFPKILEYPTDNILSNRKGRLEIESFTETTAERMLVYATLLQLQNTPQAPIIIITTGPNLCKELVPPHFLKQHIIRLQSGATCSLNFLIEKLMLIGYEKVDLVEKRGEIAVRGGIIDIFNIVEEQPIRVELDGDKVVSIRYFDVETQRSIQNFTVSEINIYPASEQLLLKKYTTQNPINSLSLFFDYLPENTLIVFDEFYNIENKILKYENFPEKKISTFSEEEQRLLQENSWTNWANIINKKESFTILYLSLIKENWKNISQNEVIHEFELKSYSPSQYHGKIKELTKDIKDWYSKGYFSFIICDNVAQKEHILELLKEENITPIEYETRKKEPYAKLFITVGELTEGFILPQAKVAIITNGDIFLRYTRVRKTRRFSDEFNSPLSSLDELKIGDFVVHIDHGIGRYLGIETLCIDGEYSDYLVLEYADSDRLYVPAMRMHLVSKYLSGKEGVIPKLHKLGDNTWLRTKKKAALAIEKFASELLLLYTQRSLARRKPFSPDTVWQRELEASFPYEETRDQIKAIYEIKKRLEQDKPMDLLLCGDVGYGKTEVALRAAFKVVMDNKQVAFLVPTTVLAEQHYRTFTERLANFPVIVERISRFRTKKEQREILKKLESGAIDIIIGTHRLLSEDVKFKSLGLLIIDEEHRFGVRDKEKLKKLSITVDTLSLSATPIPRTLYMALCNIRDICQINTAPAARLPIITYLYRFSKDVIREACVKELNRYGQVYFVHNRVENIEEVAEIVKQAVPEARIAIAHGQMPSYRLEKVMIDFINYKYDILVSTSIIESGLDIPNVNTIIINCAETFGLAQLYQLRGRVGRRARQAYAYLLVSEGKELTKEAISRLKTICEFIALGSGLKIALKDLEIRGFGNILGPEQHGHMEAIGVELYEQLLEETIKRLKGESITFEEDNKKKIKDITLRIPIEAYIPDDYVNNKQLKSYFYRRMTHLNSNFELEELRTELIDRFGPLPNEVKNLLSLISLKIKAAKKSITSIRVLESQLIVQKNSRSRCANMEEIKYQLPTTASDEELLSFIDKVIERI